MTWAFGANRDALSDHEDRSHCTHLHTIVSLSLVGVSAMLTLIHAATAGVATA